MCVHINAFNNGTVCRLRLCFVIQSKSQVLSFCLYCPEMEKQYRKLPSLYCICSLYLLILTQPGSNPTPNHQDFIPGQSEMDFNHWDSTVSELSSVINRHVW